MVTSEFTPFLNRVSKMYADVVWIFFLEKKNTASQNSTLILALFPGSPRTWTASNRKLGGAWEQGYVLVFVGWLGVQIHHCMGALLVYTCCNMWRSLLKSSGYVLSLIPWLLPSFNNCFASSILLCCKWQKAEQECGNEASKDSDPLNLQHWSCCTGWWRPNLTWYR